MGRVIAPRRMKTKPEDIAAPSPETVEEIYALFERYADEVDNSTLSQTSKAMYIDFADCFVRWINGGFKPGMHKPGRTSNLVKK